MAQAPADFIQAGVHLGRAPAEIQTNLHLQQITQQLTQIGQTLQRLDRSINDVKVQMKN